jgi:diguanylate cyclase (GGDEF)-like protein
MQGFNLFFTKDIHLVASAGMRNNHHMTHPIDLAIDWLVDAQLSPEQRTAWNTMRAELVSARLTINDLERRVKAIEHHGGEMSTILTRPEFNREVARMLAFNDRYGGISSVVYINIENMDATAKRYGQAIIDACVREAGTTLMLNVRGSDVLGRLAGDEFGVLLSHCDNANAWRKGDQLAGLLQKAFNEMQGHQLELKVYFGAYTFKDNLNVSDGLKEAAKSMTQSGSLNVPPQQMLRRSPV